MVAPQVASLLRPHCHHIEAGTSKDRMQGKPAHRSSGPPANFRHHEGGEIAVGAREVVVEIDRLHGSAITRRYAILLPQASAPKPECDVSPRRLTFQKSNAAP